jgi:adenine phosphoribosyltransferase
MSLVEQLKDAILDVPDFPKPGIVFKDITPVLADHRLFHELIQHWVDRYRDDRITQVVGIESRGFILGAPLALALGCGFTVIRKPGKLPRPVRTQSYSLEYGTDTLCIHQDALHAEDRVVLVDDVLATGGTANAACHLVESTGAVLFEATFLMELAFLQGRDHVGQRSVYSVLTYG